MKRANFGGVLVFLGLFSAGCQGGESCSKITTCGELNLVDWCKSTARCRTDRADTRNCPSEVVCPIGYFSVSDGPESLVIPLATLRGELASKPILKLQLAASGPATQAVVFVRVDGASFGCEVESAPEGGYVGARRSASCPLPPAAGELEITVQGTRPAFRASVSLSEPTCTHEGQLCEL